MSGIELLPDEEATERTGKDAETRAEIPPEEEAEGHIRQTNEEEDEPAVDGRGGHDSLEAIL